MTLTKIARYIAEGRGQGFGRDYQPWLNVRDFPSHGRSHRAYSATVGRVHHFFSDVEYANFLTFDLDTEVVDIREQYPLPLEDTQHIAKLLKYRHPREPGATWDNVMTTDILVTYQETGRQRLIAYAVKLEKDTKNRRVQQKLEIECAYWNSKGIRHAILTERDVPYGLRQTLKWLHAGMNMDAASDETLASIKQCSQRLVVSIAGGRDSLTTLTDKCVKLDKEFNVEGGSHLAAARFLLAHRILMTNLSREDIWKVQLTELSINGKLSANVLEEGITKWNL
jgi:hypothetical protein